MSDTKDRRGRSLGTRGVLLVFSLCALADFAWSMFDRRSVIESVISAILGLFGTGLFLLVIWASFHNAPDDPSEPGL